MLTFNACEWLNKKHTIFGKVVGDTIYNLINMDKVKIDAEGRPAEDMRIISTKVIVNPFPDIIVRNLHVAPLATPKPLARPVVKNRSLLSFQQDEDESSEDNAQRVASSHDLLNDKKLAK